MREVLLFVCSKMADETKLSSKLHVQTEHERSEEESSVGDGFALVFRWARFCSASLNLFASYLPAPLLMGPLYFATLHLFPLVFKGVLVSLLLTTMEAFSDL